MVEIIEATAAHADELAFTMRPADAETVRKMRGGSPRQALRKSMNASVESWACLLNGRVLAIFGLSPLSTVGNAYAVWLATSLLVDEKPVTFSRGAKLALSVLRSRVKKLKAVVYCDHPGALRFARWLGFTVQTAHPAQEAERCIVEIAGN